MTRLLCTLALPALLLAHPEPLGETAATDKVAWLTQHAVTIQSIDPKNQDLADLLPLRKSIGTARIVLLGGSSDLAVVQAKYRLVRFLHEEMGFDVLVSSASFFEVEELDRAWDRGSGNIGLEISASGSFVIRESNRGPREWNHANILSYLHATHKTPHPLHAAGFGTNLVTSVQSDYPKKLFKFIDSIDPKLCPPADRKAIKSLLSLNENFFRVRQQDWQKAIPPAVAAASRLSDKLAQLPPDRPEARETLFYRQTLANLVNVCPGCIGLPAFSRASDLLVWHARTWRPGSKFIVWSDNNAVGRNLPAPRGPSGRPAYVRFTLGSTLARQFGSAVYSIAFTETKTDAQVLEVLVAGPQPGLAPVGDNFESLVHAIGEAYTFIDFRSLPPDHWLRLPLTARFINGAEVSKWPENYDGIVGIDLTLKKRHTEEARR